MSELHKTLYLAYRPQNFDELEGQVHIKETLKNATRLGKLSHAYLFSGPRGTGKTSTARILAKAMNCTNLLPDGNPCGTCSICVDVEHGFMVDVIEIDAASHRSIDDIRDLREKVRFAPTLAKRKVYIIDEVHMLTKDAFNALLKTLEEPPEHVYFILATTEFHKVIPTIVSRCQLFQFYGLSEEDLVRRLTQVCTKEAFSYEKDALEMIAKEAGGGARDALSLLEKVAFQGETITVSLVSTLLGRGSAKLYEDLQLAISTGTHEELFSLLQHVERRGIPADSFMKGFITFLRTKLLRGVFEEKAQGEVLLILSTLIQEIEKGLGESKQSLLPYLPFEVRLLQLQLKASGVAEITPTAQAPQVQKEVPTNLAPVAKITPPPVEKTSTPEPLTPKAPTVKKVAPERVPTPTPEIPQEPLPSVEVQPTTLTGTVPPLSTIKRDWESITGGLTKSIAKLTFGRHSFPRDLQENRLILGVFGPLHMNKAEENKGDLEKLLAKHFSCDIVVVLEEEEPQKVTPRAPSNPHATATPVIVEKAAPALGAEDIAEFMGGTIL